MPVVGAPHPYSLPTYLGGSLPVAPHLQPLPSTHHFPPRTCYTYTTHTTTLHCPHRHLYMVVVDTFYLGPTVDMYVIRDGSVGSA